MELNSVDYPPDYFRILENIIIQDGACIMPVCIFRFYTNTEIAVFYMEY